MRFLSSLRERAAGSEQAPTRPRSPRRKPVPARLHVEQLEDRSCPSVSYSVTDLGNLGSGDSNAFAINDYGQVVGYADTGSQADAFLWSPWGTDGVPTNPRMKDLGTLGGTFAWS